MSGRWHKRLFCVHVDRQRCGRGSSTQLAPLRSPGILGEQCNQVDNSVPGRRGEERERQTKNRDESSRHRSLSLSRHHWVGLGVLWELVRRWTFVFDSHKAVSPPQQPVNILYGFTVKEKVASALAPSTRSTPADTSEIELQGVLLKSVGCSTRLRHAACP